MAEVKGARDILKHNLRIEREKQVKRDDDRLELKLERLKDMLIRLMSGKQMSAKAGREMFWEFFCNHTALKKDVFTGNSETFKRIGEQQWAKDMIEFAKLTDIKLYQMMELEAIARDREE